MRELKWYDGFRWFCCGLKRSFNWKERATRAEYAWVLIISRLLALPLWFFAKHPEIFEFVLPKSNIGFVFFLHVIYHALRIPELAVSVRRLHDLGHSGFWLIPIYVPWLTMGFLENLSEMNDSFYYLIESIFFDLFLMLVVFSRIALSFYLILKDGKRMDNKYGIDPKKALSDR
ncbi:DUF805 domain-containing protein [Bartonella sp. B41]